jgi:hypothetical protein
MNEMNEGSSESGAILVTEDTWAAISQLAVQSLERRFT